MAFRMRVVVLVACAIAILGACTRDYEGDLFGLSPEGPPLSSDGGVIVLDDGATVVPVVESGVEDAPDDGPVPDVVVKPGCPDAVCTSQRCDFLCSGTACGCTEACPNGVNCTFECKDGAPCNITCGDNAEGCDVVCRAGSSCKVTCERGPCKLTCEGNASCSLACGSGSCDLDCKSGSKPECGGDFEGCNACPP